MQLIRIIKIHSFSIYFEAKEKLEGRCFFRDIDYKDPHPKDGEFKRLLLIDPLSIFKRGPFIVSCSKYEEIPNGGTDPRTNDEQGSDQTDHQ
jgi:hypothetical protein